MEKQVKEFTKLLLPRVDEYEELLSENRIWKDRLVNVGSSTPRTASSMV
jgi:NADH:ubiquinone oxidoreductase subunit D